MALAKERDRFMTPQQALEFGLIDQVVSTREEASRGGKAVAE